MKLLKIDGDLAEVLFADQEAILPPGSVLQIQDACEKGIIVQVLNQKHFAFGGQTEQIAQEMMQQMIEHEQIFTHEDSMDSLKHMFVAECKIQHSVSADDLWRAYNGIAPSREAKISILNTDTILAHAVPIGECPLPPICRYQGHDVIFNGPDTKQVNLVAGARGQGKSGLIKAVAGVYCSLGIPVVLFDVNHEFEILTDHPIRWGLNHAWMLHEIGWQTLANIVKAILPWAGGENSPSQGVFESVIQNVFINRRGQGLDVPYLMGLTFSNQQHIQGAIMSRLSRLDEMGLIAQIGDDVPSLSQLFSRALSGTPLVFDLSHLSTSLQRSLASSVIRGIERILDKRFEVGDETGCSLFLDEGQLYLGKESHLLTGLCSRARHSGIQTWLISANIHQIPDVALQSCDNLFAFRLTSELDQKALKKIGFVDSSLEHFCRHLQPRQCVIQGALTRGMPLHCRTIELKESIASSGATRSPWRRIMQLSLEQKEN